MRHVRAKEGSCQAARTTPTSDALGCGSARAMYEYSTDRMVWPEPRSVVPAARRAHTARAAL
eukprot:2188864-Alexandrium_andersonii.AAC.1